MLTRNAKPDLHQKVGEKGSLFLIWKNESFKTSYFVLPKYLFLLVRKIYLNEIYLLGDHFSLIL